MPSDGVCPVLTDKGKELINHNIKDALHEIIVYGVQKNDLASKEELIALLQSDRATKEQLEKFKIVEKKPLVSFFDIDKKLTVRVNLSYDDLIRKDVTIEGIGILGKEGDIVSLFPDHAILDNPQANLEALIKIHSVVGEPGQVEYYTGTYLTREEYEAAKVPMVNEVFKRTQEVVEPQIKTTIDNFKAEGTATILAQTDNFEQLKAKYERELLEIKEQATQDLTGMQDYISKLHRLGRLEQATIHMYDRLCRMYKNLYYMFQDTIDLFQKAKTEREGFGTLGIFSQTLPRGYIYFNSWYPIKDFVCFYKNFKYGMITSADRTKFMVRWEPNTQIKPDKVLDSLYIKVSITGTPQPLMNKKPQQLPTPFKYYGISDYEDEMRLSTRDNPGGESNGIFKALGQWGSLYRMYPGSSANAPLVTNTIRVNLKEYRDAIVGWQENIRANPTYSQDLGANVEVESTLLSLGIKAGLSFNLKEEMTKIMDKAFVDC